MSNKKEEKLVSLDKKLSECKDGKVKDSIEKKIIAIKQESVTK